MEQEKIDQMLKKKGFIDEDLDPGINLADEIDRLRKEKNAVILSHYYVEGDLQDIADHVGDSLGLSQAAAATNAEMIVFVGVHFMAETAKILNPEKKVILPDLQASCSLAEAAPAEEFAKFKAQYRDHKVITYINENYLDRIMIECGIYILFEPYTKDQSININISDVRLDSLTP